MSVIDTKTKAEFKDNVVDSNKVVLVDFWAEWCPPCRAMAPVLNAMDRKYDGLDVVKVNVEESQDNAMLAQEHGVSGIPNMVIYKGGKQVKNLVGMRPAPVLENELKEFLDQPIPLGERIVLMVLYQIVK